MLEVLLCWKKRETTDPTSIVICKRLVVILFVLIISAVLVILSIGVRDDIPNITRVYTSTNEIPLPGDFN